MEMGEDRVEVKAGIIGAGIGRVHLEGYQAAGAEVVALCDANESRARETAEKYGVRKVYTDYKEMLKDAEINTISVCTPNSMHASMSIDALEAGKHVICEKPLSVNAADAQRIVDAAAKSDKKFMVAFCYRFREDAQLMKKFVEGGELGRIYYAKTAWLRRRGIPGFGGWFTTKELSGGGPLIDLGVHMLDLTLWLMGNPRAVSVSGSAYAEFGPYGRGAGGYGRDKNLGGKYDVEDLAIGLIKLENGATLHLEASWATNIEKDGGHSTLIGTEGGACLNFAEGGFKLHKEMYGHQVDVLPVVKAGSGHKDEMAHFVKCIQEDKAPTATGEQGLEIMRILDAIYESAATGKEVML